MRRLSPQQIAMLRRVEEDQHAIPHGWIGNRRIGADRTRCSLQACELIAYRTPSNTSAPYVLTDNGRRYLATISARDPAAQPERPIDSRMDRAERRISADDPDQRWPAGGSEF
jgi:hypothetical protein